MLSRLLLLLCIGLAPGHAWGQGHRHSHRGGQEVRIGSYEAELVVRGSQVTLYVNDVNDQKVDSASLSASAVVLAKGNQQRTLELAPAGENTLVGTIDFPIEGKLRATVTLRTEAGEVGKGRYNLEVSR
jgi:hypothetical protein